MIYTNYGCGSHFGDVTWTYYWLGGFEMFYVQYLFGKFCFNYIPSCNSPEDRVYSILDRQCMILDSDNGKGEKRSCSGLMQVSVQLQPTANKIYNSYMTNARHL